MTLIRNYVDNQATLIKNNNSNNSKNPVFEIVRGNSLYSRYIFSVDLVPLRNKLINEYGITSGNVSTQVIKFYNSINLRNDLIGKQNVDGFFRDNNFELQLFKIDENFTNGTSYNYNYSLNLTPNNIEVPNWYYKDKVNTWIESGIYTGNTVPNILATQFLTQGNENLEFDITNTLINVLYNSTATTLNLGISYTADYENSITGNTESNYIVSFFSKYTQTFFEPCIETTTNDIIIDDRIKFYLDEPNKLYLYPNKPITGIDKVEIFDYNDDVILTLSGNSITKLNNNVYYINLVISSTDYPDMVNFTDKWYYKDINNKSKIYSQEFTLLTDENFLNNEEESYLNSKFYFSTFGINNNETISQSEKKRRVQVITKRLFNSIIEDNIPVDHLQYRIYILQGSTQIEIIPFTNINKTFINNYFDIDIESLIPQTYYIEIKLDYNGITLSDTKSIKFKIASEK